MVRAGDEPDAMYGLAALKVGRSADGTTYQFVMRRRQEFQTARRSPRKMSRSRSTSSKPRVIRSLPSRCATSSAPKPTMTKPSPRLLRRSAPATCRYPSPPCRSSRARITLRSRSTNPASDTPLGSGAYKVGRFEPGRYIEYDRVQGLVGRRSPGRTRPEQFRRFAL